MKLKYVVAPAVLIFALTWCIADEGAIAWATFGEGVEQERFANCFVISYPSTFSVDPASGISPKSNAGNLPIPEENLHTLVLHDGNKSLEVRACSYSYLDGEALTSRGFGSPREVILTSCFTNPMTIKISRMQGFDLFYSETDSEVIAIFLDRSAKWGFCYQSLTFLFRNGTKFEDHAEVVKRIITNFVPSFARPKKINLR